MKIAFDAKRVFHNFTGLGNYGRTLIESLTTHYPEHEYVLYTPAYDDPRGEQWLDSVKKMRVEMPECILGRMFPSAWRSFFLTNVLEKDPPDIYHGLSHELPAGIHRTPIKTVVTIHDLIFLRYPEQFSRIDRSIYKRKINYSCSVSQKIVAICEQTKNDLMEFLNIREDKIDVIYQSCDPIFYEMKTREERDRIRKKYFLPTKYILFVGSFTERKNLLNLVRGLFHSQRTNDVPLVLVGRGKDYRNRIYDLAKKLGVHTKLIFLENVPLNELPAIYQNATVFIYPSLFEGFGIPIIEAFFSGVPVITSTGSCFKETGGPAAIYVDPNQPEQIGEAMVRVVENESLQQNLIEKGRDWVNKFHSSNTAKNMMEFYKTLT
ncbi:MAG: glycosyltransferase family 4 protein [Bacteriovoracaceae bacterium]|nr:glycosyltransferase family 4 protein [Bacteriovoracaceae bacterium]